MPASLTYPGVYVEEIPSGVRTIMGVSTSVTAFIGRAKKGPVNKATTINNYGDYERIFGGLDLNSMMSYAVRDFYLNGGSQAVIVRLYNDFSEQERNATQEPRAKTTFFIGDISLEAANPGSWGSTLRGKVTLISDSIFNLNVTAEGYSEDFLNLSFEKGSLRRIDKIVNSESKLITFKWKQSYTVNNLTTGYYLEDKQNKIYVSAILKKEQDVRDKNGAVLKEQDNLDQARRSNADNISELENRLNQAKIDLKTALDNLKTAQDNLKASDGKPLEAKDILVEESKKIGLHALDDIDIFNLLCIPPYTGTDENGNPTDIDLNVISEAVTYCAKRRAMLLVDSSSNWRDKESAKEGIRDSIRDKNAALFFPRLMQPNPLRGNQIEEFVPCGAVAGIIARTDAQRGFWKAPAGIDATLRGVSALSVELTNDENGELNPLGINCLRSFPNVGKVVWGARTLRGADILADEWKYLPVRRTALYIEESLYRGTQWVVFEPNDEPLWAQIRLNVGAFMHNLFRKGAFQGTTPKEAYFVKCDKETTTQNDIDLGIVNIVVGFAPLKPAEFVVIKLQQIAGDLQV